MAEFGEERRDDRSEQQAIQETEISPAETRESSEAGLSFDPAELQQIAEDSDRFIASWHELVSRTNWEKGKIICQWRDKVCSLHPDIQAISDRAWSQLIGNISPEHVGRLRRTFEKFGQVYSNYAGLSWTHFMVATAWDDAEMWLEGASQNSWTIEQMRRTRWESLGAVTAHKPDDSDVIVEEIAANEVDRAVSKGDGDVIEGPILEGPDWGESEPQRRSSISREKIDEILDSAPFELVDAFNAFAAAVERCRDSNWDDLKRGQLFKLFTYLQQLARQ